MIEIKNKLGSELVDIFKNIFVYIRKDGIIECLNNANNSINKIYIKENQIVYAHSSSRKARFGDLLIKKGIINNKDLELALDEQKKKPEKLIGNILVEMNIISERVIPNLLFNQIEAIIYEVLSWNNCNIIFLEKNIEEDKEFRKPISDSKKFIYTDLNKLLDSKSFINSLNTNLPELLNIKKILSSQNFIPKRINKTYPAQLNFDQRKILRFIDNTNTINDIIILSDLDYFKTYQILYYLFNEKIISIPIDKKEENNNYKENLKEEKLIDIPKPLNVFNSIEENNNISIQEYKILLASAKNEIDTLSKKLSIYEGIKITLPEDINKRILKLEYNKKVILSNIIKNILDFIE